MQKVIYQFAKQDDIREFVTKNEDRVIYHKHYTELFNQRLSLRHIHVVRYPDQMYVAYFKFGNKFKKCFRCEKKEGVEMVAKYIGMMSKLLKENGEYDYPRDFAEYSEQHFQHFSLPKGVNPGDEIETTTIDINQAYLWWLSKPVPDMETFNTVCIYEHGEDTVYIYEDVIMNKRFINRYHPQDSKSFGLKFIGQLLLKPLFQKTALQVAELRKENPEYKLVGNIFIGCMKKRYDPNKQNATTIHAWIINEHYKHMLRLIMAFEKAGISVVKGNIDSLTLHGIISDDTINMVLNKYGMKISSQLGDVKIEHRGKGKYFNAGHYEESGKIKWKGKAKGERDANF